MAITKVLARDWKLELVTGVDEVTSEKTYTVVEGINSLTFSSEKNDAETTTFDDNGRNTHLVASRGYSLTIEGMYLVDVVTGDRDAGQLAVEAVGDKIGPESIGEWRLTDPANKERTFGASVNVGDVGGGNDDPTSWGAELTVSGAVVFPTAVVV